MTGLADALVKAQAEMPAVDKDGTNPHFQNRFASLDNIIAKTRPVLNRHGLAVVQFPAVSELGAPTLRTIIVHNESGEQMSADMPLFVSKQDMQGLGSAITYARRYAWAAALGIASDEDDDGNHAASSSAQAAQTAQQSQPSQSSQASTITEPQRKRLFAIAKAKNVDDETVKRLVKEVAGVDSSSAVPKAKYDALVAAVEMAAVTAGATGGGFVDESEVPF